MLDPDPLAAMYAAVLAIADGEVGEIEIDWAVESDGMECRLSVTVRREVRQFVVDPPPTDQETT